MEMKQSHRQVCSISERVHYFANNVCRFLSQPNMLKSELNERLSLLVNEINVKTKSIETRTTLIDIRCKSFFSNKNFVIRILSKIYILSYFF